MSMRALFSTGTALALFFAAAPAYAATFTMPPNNLGLVGWWSMDDVSGTSVIDSSGQGNTGTTVNSPTQVVGEIGKALSFNGSSQYVQAQTTPNPGSGPYTLSAWVKTGGAQFAGIITKRLNGPTSYAQISLFAGSLDNSCNIVSSDYISISLNDGTNGLCVNTASTYLGDSRWHLVTFVWNGGGSVSIYVDGKAVATNTAFASGTVGSISNNIPWEIGNSNGIGYLNGSLDDVRIYNRALSATEVQNLYTYSRGAHENVSINPPNLQNGLVGWYTFDGNDISGTSVTDKSGNGNTGTTVNSPTLVPGVLGQALSFNGTNQYVHEGSAIIAGYPATMSVWAKTDSSTVSAVLSVTSSTSYNAFFIMLSDATVYGYATAGPGTDSAVSDFLDGNRWNLITYVLVNANERQLYINGKYVATDTNSRTPTSLDGTDIGIIGGYWNSSNCGSAPSYCANYFNGSIDDVRIYNRALSVAEVQQLYRLGTASHQNVTITPPNLASGLVGHWSFDGSTISGTSVADTSGGGNAGTLVNAPKPVIGILGQALSFNGSSQYVQSTKYFPLSGTSVLTVSAWVRRINNASSSVVTISNTTAGNYQGGGAVLGMGVYPCAPSQFKMTKFSDVDVCLGSVPTDSNWHLITGVWDSSGEKVYVDGALNGAHSETSNFTDNGTLIVSAGYDPVDLLYSPVSIDDVRIYNRALSAAEAQQLYNLGR